MKLEIALTQFQIETVQTATPVAERIVAYNGSTVASIRLWCPPEKRRITTPLLITTYNQPTQLDCHTKKAISEGDDLAKWGVRTYQRNMYEQFDLPFNPDLLLYDFCSIALTKEGLAPFLTGTYHKASDNGIKYNPGTKSFMVPLLQPVEVIRRGPLELRRA